MDPYLEEPEFDRLDGRYSYRLFWKDNNDATGCCGVISSAPVTPDVTLEQELSEHLGAPVVITSIELTGLPVGCPVGMAL